MESKVEISKMIERLIRSIDGYEGYAITLHVVKEGKIDHNIEAVNFPNNDWKRVAESIEKHGRSIAIKSTGKAKA